jgi:hypothetical protein
MVSSALDDCGPGNCDCPDSCAGADSCADPEFCDDADNCTDPENFVERQFEGAKFGPGTEVVSAVCAGVEICDLAGAVGSGIGALMAGAVACAPPVAAGAAFSWLTAGAAESARLRVADPGCSVAVPSAFPLDVVWVMEFSTAFHVEWLVSGKVLF